MPHLGLSLSTTASNSVFEDGFPLRVSLATLGNFLKTAPTQYIRWVYDINAPTHTIFWTENSGNSTYYVYATTTSISGPSMLNVKKIIGTTWDGKLVGTASQPTLVTISDSPQTFTYSASMPTLTISSNEANLETAIRSNLSFSGVSAGSYTATITGQEYPDYRWVYTEIPVTINKKNATLTLTSGSTSYGQTPTPVSTTGLVGSDTITNAFTNLITGTIPTNSSAPGSYAISFNTGYSSTNYTITNSPSAITWTISKANQTISFSPATTGNNGSSQTLSATATSGLSVSFSVVSGPGTLSGNVLTYTGNGTIVVRASQAGDTNYNPASNVDVSVVITTPSSGLSVASTPSITISGNVELNGVHTRVPQGTTIMDTGFTGNPDTFVLNGGTYLYRRPNSVLNIYSYNNSVLFPPNSTIKSGGGSGGAVAGTPFTIWTMASIQYDNEYGEWVINQDYVSTNPSTDPTIIPTSGWTGYYGNFTITAT
jgi:hypothetical protein